MSAPAEILSQHVYVCDQDSDPCYEIKPREGETWRDLAERRAAHVVAVLELERAPQIVVTRAEIVNGSGWPAGARFAVVTP
jgi:hypothetical protein